jgi:hypothetical protein
MAENKKQAQLLPADISHLTFEVAKNYLEKKSWTPHEAVMLIAGYNPECRAFYDDDDAEDSLLARLVWRGVREFNHSGKSLPIESWIDWATDGTIDYPRIAPIGLGPELKKAIGKSGLKSLQKTLSQSNEESQIPIKEVKVKGAWRAKVQEAAFNCWCKLYGAGSNPSVNSISKEMARWCVENNVKNDYNGHPSTGSIRNSVLDAKSWEPPSMSREKARQFVSDAPSIAQVAQVAQVQK